MRILVLGDGPGAAKARTLARQRGLPLARHALDSVTYIVVDETVNPRDPKLIAARALGVHVMGDREFVANPEAWPTPRGADESGLAPYVADPPFVRRSRHHGTSRQSLRHGYVPHPRSRHGRSPEVQRAMDALFTAIGNADPAAVRRAMRGLGSVLWALSPLITGGLSAPVIFGHAAAKLKSVLMGIAAAVYAGLAVGALTLIALETDKLGDERFADVNPVGFVMLLALVLGSTTHAFMVRGKVFPVEEGGGSAGSGGGAGAAGGAAVPASAEAVDEVEARALARRERRARARKILAEDPALAEELGIGRPELGLGYDDGGLVDVNHAPEGTLAEMRGVDAETAERIVRVREMTGGYGSVEELVVRADLDPAVVRIVGEYAVFG